MGREHHSQNRALLLRRTFPAEYRHVPSTSRARDHLCQTILEPGCLCPIAREPNYPCQKALGRVHVVMTFPEPDRLVLQKVVALRPLRQTILVALPVRRKTVECPLHRTNHQGRNHHASTSMVSGYSTRTQD